VGAMQHTSIQFHICIMKKLRQHFKIAIITPSDGFTHISMKFANPVSNQKTAPSWQGIPNARDNQGTENSMEFFRGRPWPFRHLSKCLRWLLIVNILNVLIKLKIMREGNSKQLSRYNLLNASYKRR